ncbi:hypothetical protein ABBQ32_003417 [Trebouxia sp. C0010 RCD-2024]
MSNKGNRRICHLRGSLCRRNRGFSKRLAKSRILQVPGQKETLPAILTLPPYYLKPDKVKELGIVLGHGSNAADWNGKFFTELAAALAAEGYLVVRCYCKQKEQRRQRMFEKALDAAATSPFARGITRWLLAGIGNGARIAAAVGTKCRGSIAGFALLSYPLEEPEPMPPGKGRRNVEATPGPPDSGADATLKPPQARSHNAVIFRTVADTVLEFAEALNQNQLHSSSLPRFEALSAEQPELDSAALLTTASGSQEAHLRPDESQQAQPQADDMTAQVAGVTQAPAIPQETMWPAEQGLPGVPRDHSGTHAQHSYDPGPFAYSC